MLKYLYLERNKSTHKQKQITIGVFIILRMPGIEKAQDIPHNDVGMKLPVSML